MPNPSIRADCLGKQYRFGRSEMQRNTIRDVISHSFGAGANAVRRIFRRGRRISPAGEWFWALRDVAFEVPAGQVVGIIGANGAGKSTLLKVLSRITEPTTGRVEVRGRVGSLIEVGTGFHSELTGRENTYLNGAILGMPRSEIERKFDEIVAFAGVERFIDTPIKHYSSGMQLRLGFAVAAHLETEILMVDEVLAVGDAEFQKKCLSTMSRVANDGRTVLFVSHNPTAVRTLCDRAIWLKEGRIAADGAPAEVISSYLMSSAGTIPERFWHRKPEPGFLSPVSLRRVAARAESGLSTERITTASPFLIEVDYWISDPNGDIGASFAVFNEQDVLLFESMEPTRNAVESSPEDAMLARTVCHLPSNLLSPGTYRLEVTLRHNHRHAIEEPEALYFTIFDRDGEAIETYRQRPSVIRPLLHWESSVLTIDHDEKRLG
jgi:lipopolysaccharide transport system ATP-binding protein